ncbi:hypothetical protein EDD85DRAFT_944901 [Armillaria nabsnona]|nr:hypothetical protein EDD85DRAFT_944901 [Armillaria nabsnona]
MSHLAPQHLTHTRMGPSLPWHRSLIDEDTSVLLPHLISRSMPSGWKSLGRAAEKSSSKTPLSGVADEAVAIIVGRVSPEQTISNSPRQSFNLHFSHLKDTEFIDDFKEALDILAASQWSAGITGDNKNLFAPDWLIYGTVNLAIRASKNGKSQSDVQSELDKIKQSHEVCPLLVYNEQDNRILPEKVASALSGALVELHFTLLHWVLRPKDQKPFDSFTAKIIQICILGPPMKTSSLPDEQCVATKHFHPANVANVEKTKEIVDKGSLPEEAGGDADSGSTISEWSRSDQDEAEKSNRRNICRAIRDC